MGVLCIKTTTVLLMIQINTLVPEVDGAVGWHGDKHNPWVTVTRPHPPSQTS